MNQEQLKNSYQFRLNKIEIELEKTLPSSINKKWITTHGGENLSFLTKKQAEIFNAPAKHLLSLGGKRWRPILMQLACELANKKKEAYPFTPIVELPHNGSLIIDDIEDSSNLRRGKPAAHIQFGNDIAINAGNLIYFLPTTLIEVKSKTAKMKAELYEIYSRCMRRLHFGQGLDIQWHRDNSIIPNTEEYKTMCRLKTGSLSRMAAEMGYQIGGGKKKKGKQLAQIAEDIGVGFQIADDIINLKTGNPGKKRGDDIIEKKRSLPVVLFANENNPKILLEKMEKAASIEIEKSQSIIEESILLLENSGAIKQAKKIAMNIMSNASLSLTENFSDCEAREVINFMIKSFKIP